MDWAKAKTILIVLLLLLNGFLLSGILYSNYNNSVNSDYTKYAMEFLESKHIELQTSVPTYSTASGRIEYTTKVIDESLIVKRLLGDDPTELEISGEKKTWHSGEKSLEINDSQLIYRDESPNSQMSIESIETVEKEIKNLISDLKLNSNTYILDAYDRQGDLVILKFIEKIKGQLFFDNQITVTVSDNGITTMEITLREIKNIIKVEEILSAYHILVAGRLPENAVITSIRFGYRQMKEENLFDSPCWRVDLAGGKTIYYDAYTGEKVE